VATAVAAALATGDGPALVRLPPSLDLLGLVLGVLERTGPGALVVVPSTGWAGRLAARLARRGLAVTGVGPEHPGGWARAASGWDVVVGSRAAVWAPRPTFSVVLVLDAHDEALRSGWPAYGAWELAAERAARAGAPCVLVTPCPTATQLAAGRLWEPGRPLEAGGWPPVVVVDRRAADPRTGLLSDELVSVARRVLADGGPLVCVLNRTGRARLLACAACGELARCERCGSLVAQADEALVCRRCGLARPVVCAACGGTRLKVLRPGVSRLREELAALLGVGVAEVAGPAGEGPVPDEPVLVGTEAVLHRVRHAAAVAFLDFDQHLLAARLGAEEAALALLVRAGRLVGGRADGPRGGPGATGVRRRGPVLVQTRLGDHPVLTAAVRGDPGPLGRRELELRRELSLPPFAALATLSGPGGRTLAEALGGADVEISELGEDRRLVRAADHQVLCDALAAAPRPVEPVRVTVDPADV
jgi:primosomal protein N' (replication factor Y)